MTSVIISSAGVQGPQGNGWRSGVGAPSSSVGVDGDFYLDTTNVGYYYGAKTAGVWGTPHPFGNSLNGVPLGNYVATADPTAANDSTQGYSVGSIWVNTTASRVSVASSVAVSAAVWSSLSNLRYVTVTSNYTVAVTDRTVYVNAAAGPITITLFSAVNTLSRIDVKKIDTTNNPVTVVAQAGKLIDGASSYIIGSPYQASMFAPDGIGGGNWYVL